MAGKDWMRGIAGAMQSGLDTAMVFKKMGDEEKRQIADRSVQWFAARTERIKALDEKYQTDLNAKNAAWQKDQGNKRLQLERLELQHRNWLEWQQYYLDSDAFDEVMRHNKETERTAGMLALAKMKAAESGESSELAHQRAMEIVRLRGQLGMGQAVFEARADAATRLALSPQSQYSRRGIEAAERLDPTIRGYAGGMGGMGGMGGQTREEFEDLPPDSTAVPGWQNKRYLSRGGVQGAPAPSGVRETPGQQRGLVPRVGDLPPIRHETRGESERPGEVVPGGGPVYDQREQRGVEPEIPQTPQPDIVPLGQTQSETFERALSDPDSPEAHLAELEIGEEYFNMVHSVDTVHEFWDQFGNNIQEGEISPGVPRNTPMTQDLFEYMKGTIPGGLNSRAARLNVWVIRQRNKAAHPSRLPREWTPEEMSDWDNRRDVVKMVR